MNEKYKFYPIFLKYKQDILFLYKNKQFNIKLFLLLEFSYRPTLSAQFSPSNAAEIIPPAKPAPSPQG